MSSLEEFRLETRKWLEENCPPSQRKPEVRSEQVWAGRNKVFPSKDAELWLNRMAERGWTAPDWPAEYGGGGLTPEQTEVFREEMARLGCRGPLYDLGLMMLGQAILAHGTEEQKQEHIPKIVRGDIRWCQGFSEPGAGSDLAGLKCRAEDKGDHYLVNGTKLWTSFADRCDWIFCLVRTDPEAVPKRAGISVLLIDLESPGASVTPIKLINDTSEFCQTFFDNVIVPKENLLGEINKGWDVVGTVLRYERKLMSAGGMMTKDHANINLVELARKYIGNDKNGQLLDHCIRDSISHYLMNARADQLTVMRLAEQVEAGKLDPRLPPIMKYVATSEVQQRDQVITEILGNRCLSWEDDHFTAEEKKYASSWAFNKSVTIAGGTSEVQLNIIAKRVLGLPSR